MEKIKVVDLAKELNLDPKELLKKLKEEGFPIKTISSSLMEEEVERVRQLFTSKKGIILIKKEEVISQEEVSEEPVIIPKKKKLILKKKPPAEIQKEEPEVVRAEVQPSLETSLEERVSMAEISVSQELSTPEEVSPVEEKELSEELTPEIEPTPKLKEERPKESPDKRIVTDFTKRREKPFKPKFPKERLDKGEKPPSLPEEVPKEEVVKKEEFKKKKREELFLEERKKQKKKFAFPKKRKEEMEELLLEEEPESEILFLEKVPALEEEEEVLSAKVRVKPKEKLEKVPERPPTLPPKERKVKVYETIQVGELAKLMGVKVSEVIKKSLQMGMPLTINQSIDADTAAILAYEFGYEVEKAPIEEEILLQYIPPSPEELKPRPPVVTVMGHVDHGKTTLLDAIRKTDVVSQEAGGITQHIGAYTVRLEDGRTITFIDTPGHEAFTSMRARGAQVTDIVILVVAADDGVMEQTKEAIEHARAAKVPIVVAINKIDKPEANIEKVKSQLADLGLIPEEWGGDTLTANISAKKKIGINDLLELVLLQAEMLDLKAAYDRPARGRIIESKLDKGRGPVATVLIQEGTLKEGDIFIAGTTYGRVRAMFDSYGQRIKIATPSVPAEILGFEELPQAGDDFIVIETEEKARKIAEYRQRKAREAEIAKETKISLEKIFEKLKEGELKELKIVLKTDTQGTLEALKTSLEKLSSEKVKVNIIRAGIGAISESDVMLASASEAVVIGFNVKPTPQAKEVAKNERVDIRFYDVIYNLLDDVKKAMVGLLEPKYEEKIIGIVEIRAVFKIPKIGMVAGCYVKDGIVNRSSRIRVIRDGVVIYTGRIASLKRFKEDVREVPAGYECGIRIEGFQDIKVGDLIEVFEIKEVLPEL
ncbi:MAG: translation initiation factor IF-2 [Thermodesulfobacterium sp.]|nr:translation initiation factor IF-2 [Thermodesulfobacterium sp.]